MTRKHTCANPGQGYLLCDEEPGKVNFVKIFIDSQAAIVAVGNSHVTSKAVAEAIDSLNKLSKIAKSVTLILISAHKGHVGNDRTDVVLAKAGLRETEVTKGLFVDRPQAAVKAAIKENIYHEWQLELSQMKMVNHAKSF